MHGIPKEETMKTLSGKVQRAGEMIIASLKVP